MREQNNERAKLFAEAFGKLSSLDAVAHIYDDGYVLAVPMNVDRQLRLLTHIKKFCPEAETARSPDGMFAIFVLPDDLLGRPIPAPEGPTRPPSDSEQLYCSVVLMTERYHDHRQQDHHEINHALALYNHCLEIDLKDTVAEPGPERHRPGVCNRCGCLLEKCQCATEGDKK
jgi:hypothetical protein